MPSGVQYASPANLGGIVEFAVEIALGAQGGDGDTAVWQPFAGGALWDTVGTWGGLIPSWVDVTPRVLGAKTNRGRDRWEQEFRTGIATVTVDNEDGLFTPDVITDIGAVALRPGRWLRVLGRANPPGDTPGPWVPLWTGQIDAMEDRYGPGAYGISSAIRCLDFGARFQIDDPPALETPIPAGQLSSDRVQLLLDEAGWPDEAFWRDIDTGEVTLASSALAGSRWSEMQAAAIAEGGAMYIAANGVPTFRNRDWLEGRLTDPPLFSIGAVDSPVQILHAATDWSQQRIYNDVRYARVGGTEIRVQDGASRSLYGPRTTQRFDLECETDGDVQYLAERFLAAYKFDRARVDEIELVPVSAAGVAYLLELQLGDKVRVTVQTRGEGQWAYTDDYFVNKIQHDITADDWVTTLRIDIADFEAPLQPASFTEAFTEAFDSEAPGV